MPEEGSPLPRESEATSLQANHYRDYAALASKYEYLRPFLHDGKFEYSYEGQCALTCAIIKEDYDIDIDAMEGHLVPAVPSRVAYLRIVQRVLRESGSVIGRTRCRGLDVGTGPYAIYAILGVKEFGWEMIGVDIDVESVAHANEIVQRNGMEHIKVVEADGISRDTRSIDFTVCNPPFYHTIEDKELRKDSKETSIKRAAVIGTPTELVFEGGEVGFVKKLINQSKEHHVHGGRTWFSSLLGIRSSIQELIDYLLELSITNFHVQSYQLGQTRRWILFWSHAAYHPRIFHQQDFKNVQATVESGNFNLGHTFNILRPLNVEIEKTMDDDSIVQVKVTTPGIVWSRAYRRHPERMEKSVHKFVITSSECHFIYGESFKTFQSFYTYLIGQLKRLTT